MQVVSSTRRKINIISPAVPGNLVQQVSSGNLEDAGISIPELLATVDKYYRHVQNLASNVWIITHNLNKNPSVIVIDSGNNQVEGSISYDSLNQVTITFSTSFSGEAYLN